MQTVQLLEFEDLEEDMQEKLIEQESNMLVEMSLDCLTQDLDEGHLTEEEYYEEIGCSKNYAETTAWFVPSVYYDNHKEEIDKRAEESLRDNRLFNHLGQSVRVGETRGEKT